MIKSHHNVGGLPDHVDFKEIIEPLRDLFKDEVRQVGEILGIPRDLVWRQPFPGPGLAIRVIGDITQERLDILREADAIYREEIARAGLDKEIWQYFTVLTNMRSVGVTKSKSCLLYTSVISQLASGFRSIAKVSSNNDILAIENEEEQLYGFMLDHQAFFTQWGMTILKNFLYHICNCSGDWKMQDYAETTIKSLREQIRCV